MKAKLDVEACVSRILTEDILTLSQVRTEMAQIDGHRRDKATLSRWIHKGCGDVKLEAIRIGRQLLTSRQALTRFIESRSKGI